MKKSISKKQPLLAPTIKIYLTGLFLIQFDKAKKFCEVHVHCKTNEHYCSIYIREKNPNGQDLTRYRHFGPIESMLWLDVPPRVRGVTLDDDLKHSMLNLQSDKFHNRELAIGETGSSSFFITGGKFVAVEKTVKSIVRKGGGQPNYALGKVASVIGAEIFLKPEESAFLMQEGENAPLVKFAAGKHYEIFLENDPLTAPAADDHDFRHYYKILPEIKAFERFDLDEADNTILVIRDFPCYSVVLD